MDSSKRKIGLFSKEKVGFDSIVRISPAERLDMLITDWDVLDEELDLFREKGIEVKMNLPNVKKCMLQMMTLEE